MDKVKNIALTWPPRLIARAKKKYGKRQLSHAVALLVAHDLGDDSLADRNPQGRPRKEEEPEP